MASKKIEKLRLRSTGLNAKGKSTGFYYTTTKNRTNTPDKLKKMKFDPRAVKDGKKGCHVLFEETKIK